MFISFQNVLANVTEQPPVGDIKQNMTAISSDKKVCVRCSVLGLCSLHRRVDRCSSRSARVPLVREFVSSIRSPFHSSLLSCSCTLMLEVEQAPT